MDLVDALAFITPRRNGVLATTKRDGRPQLSNITYHLGGDGLIRISITATRAKYANLVRTAQASLHVAADDFWAYATGRFERCARLMHDPEYAVHLSRVSGR